LSLGIKIQKEWTYKVSFWAKSAGFSGDVNVSLKSKSGTIFATHTVSGLSTTWKQFNFTMTPSATASDGNNLFTVTVDGAQASGKTIFMGMFSLFPPTFRGRENGMRIDLAEMMIGTKPSIWRFPGIWNAL
jgi:alpha-N-arabinofuranosidase